MLDLQKSIKMFSIEDQAIELAEDFAGITNEPFLLTEAVRLIEMIYDDYLTEHLKWNVIMGDTAELYMQSLSAYKTHDVQENLQRRYAKISSSVEAHLASLFPYKTWGYLFLRSVGTTFIIEDCGDRRIDEWSIITANGTITPDSVIKAVTDTIEGSVNREALANYDIEALVKSVYQLALQRRT